jgi:hypothetical protein
MPSVSTQTTTFMPKCVPVLQKKQISKKFFASMKRIHAGVGKQVELSRREIAKEKRNYLKIVKSSITAFNKRKTVALQIDKEVAKILKEQEKADKVQDNEEEKAAKELAAEQLKAEKIDKEAAKIIKEQEKADKEAAKIIQEMEKADNEADKEDVKAVKEQAKIDKEAAKIIQEQEKADRKAAKEAAKLAKEAAKAAEEPRAFRAWRVTTKTIKADREKAALEAANVAVEEAIEEIKAQIEERQPEEIVVVAKKAKKSKKSKEIVIV